MVTKVLFSIQFSTSKDFDLTKLQLERMPQFKEKDHDHVYYYSYYM